MHLLVILVVALVVLGPDKMPDAIRKGARLLGEARQWSAHLSEELQNAASLTTATQSPTVENPVTSPTGARETATGPGPSESTPEHPTPTSSIEIEKEQP